MQPQQPAQPPTPGSAIMPGSAPNQYDFIVNHGKRGPAAWLTATSFKSRLLIVGGGFAVLLIAGILFLSLLANSGGNTNALLAVAQAQTELARISRDPGQEATQPSTQALATAIRLTLTTDRQATMTYLNALGSKPSTADLSKTQSAQTDSTLSQAKSDGTYDQTYVTIAQQALAAYQQVLKQAFDSATHATEKQLLSREYAHAGLLLEQSKATAN